MPITLVSGLPRNGKTLMAVSKMGEWFPGRPVYVLGIQILKPDVLPWTPITLAELQAWGKVDATGKVVSTFPAGAVIVVDEAHKIFQPHSPSEVPAWITALAEHGHAGLDFVVITQHPMNMSHFVRRLVQNHYHVQRIAGMERASVLWSGQGYVDLEDGFKRRNMETSVFNYPKGFFGAYESAEAHTVKRRIPRAVYYYGGAALLFVGLIVYVISSWSSFGARPPSQSGVLASASPASAAARAASSAARWGVAEAVRHIPRDPQFFDSAPAYDGKRAEVVAAPRVVGCATWGARCLCINQQSLPIRMDDARCRFYASRDFDPYVSDADRAGVPATAAASLLAPHMGFGLPRPSGQPVPAVAVAP